MNHSIQHRLALVIELFPGLGTDPLHEYIGIIIRLTHIRQDAAGSDIADHQCSSEMP